MRDPAGPTLLIDWGGTVMEDLPGMRGPMAEWPRVAVVDGAEAALTRLRERARLTLLTGAADSDAGAVRRALGRVGLSSFFETVLTPRELRSRKPARVFFERALAAVGAHPESAAVIGDDQERDARAGLGAGLAAVWLNRRGAERPDEPRLVGVGHWSEVEAALERLGLLSG